MNTEYEKVNTKESDEKEICDEEFSTKIFLRQLFVSSGTWASFFICGVYLGAPTVFIPQLRQEANTTTAITDEMASWISSGCSYGAIPWLFILTPLVAIIGRKSTLAFVYIGSVLITLGFYFSTTVLHLLIIEILQGMVYAGAMCGSITVIAEYTSPKYRGIFLTIKSATLYWGIWISNAIGTFYHWKYIAVITFFVSIYPLTLIYWPESPFFLASVGKFEECKKSHRWLKGNSSYAEKELDMLINSQINNKKVKINVFSTIKQFFIVITTKRFYKPILVCALCITMYFFSGKIVYTIYAIEILKRITGSNSAAYTAMLILDGATVFSMYIGCYLSKILKRRKLLFTSASIGSVFLLSISLYLYLVKIAVINEHKYFVITLLIGFSVSISCGPVIMATSLYAELTPLENKSYTIILISIIFSLIQSLLLKISPFIFKTLDMHGTFLFYAICMLICMLLLYKYLPETKDKTLQEIEEYFKDKDVSVNDNIVLKKV